MYHGTRAGSSPHGGKQFLMDFGQCMGPVPTNHREESEELRLVADLGLNGLGTQRVDNTSPFHWLDDGSPPRPRTYVNLVLAPVGRPWLSMGCSVTEFS